MNKILSFICLLLLGCGFALNGGDTSSGDYYVTTTIHRPLDFKFVWQEDSLVYAYASLIGPYEPVDLGSNAYINAGSYVLEFSKGEGSLNASPHWEGVSEVFDSTIVNLFYSVDSSRHLQFSLVDSIETVKSYDLDLTPVFFYTNAVKHYEIRGDSIDIFLPEGNFYVLYVGSCYNGYDNFSDLSMDVTYTYCKKIKSSEKSQTITLEIAALHRSSFFVYLVYDKESSSGTDVFTFLWRYNV